MVRSGTSTSWLRKAWAPAMVMVPVLLTLPATTTFGQGFGYSADPYQPYNFQYAPFITPLAPGPFDAGFNNGMARGIRGANQFEEYLNSLQTSVSGARAGGAGVGVRHDQPNRAYDREFGRIYQPNRLADQQFDAGQTSLNQLYFEYLREKDPRKRAELFRNYSRARSRVDRALSAPRGATGARAGTRPARGTAAGGTAAGRASEAADRDMLATPPPVTPDTSRARSRSGRTSGAPSLGPAPPISGGRGLNSPGDLTPSQVLDRAARSERSRLAPRPRGPGTNSGSGRNSTSPPPPSP